MITSAYVGVIYCISMLRDFSYINRFSIFAYWYFYSWNNIIIVTLRRFNFEKNN